MRNVFGQNGVFGARGPGSEYIMGESPCRRVNRVAAALAPCPSPPAAARVRKKATRPRQRPRVTGIPLGYVSPYDAPWNTEIIPVEGEIILPGASGAAAAVGTSATAVASASGITLEDSAVDQTVCSFRVPKGKIGIIRAYFARPALRLGFRSGHCTFSIDVSGQRTRLATRLLGIRGSFNDLIPVGSRHVARPDQVISILASNGSTATWHVVRAVMEILLVDRELYQKHVDHNV